MAIYVLKHCDECGIVVRMLPSETTISEAWTCPACQIIKRKEWIKEVVDAVARGYRPQIGDGLADLAKASYDEIKIEAGRVWSWHNAGAPVEQAQPEPLTGGQVVGGGSPVPDEAATAGGTGTTDRAMLGWLSPAERQSGYDRLMHATGLILQLPRDHDGRNTWLMNYAKDKDPVVQASIRNNPAEFTAKHASMQRGTELDNCLPLSDRTTSMIRYIKAKIEQGYTPYYTKQPEVLTPDALLFEFENASAWAGDD